MPQETVRIALVTLNPKYGDVIANKNAIIEWMEQAASRSADLVIFPEGILSGYDLDLKEQAALRLDDDALEDIAHRAEILGCVVSVGFIERADEGYYIAQAYLGNDIRQVYRKCHRTGWEKEHCLAGSELSIQDLGFIKTGTQICYDSAFPRASEHLVRSGAELLVTPTCNSFSMQKVKELGGKKAAVESRRQHVATYWRARAYDYGVYACYVENVGETNKDEFHPGYAVIYAPDGSCIIERCSAREGLISADIYPQQLTALRKQHGHHKTLADARPELYTSLDA